MDAFNIQYCFKFPDGRQQTYDLKLDAKTLDLVVDLPEKSPLWTSLDFHQCPNCTLTLQENPHCPSAVSLISLVTSCSRVLSYDDVQVEILTPERTVSKYTNAQKGLSSLIGLMMATSGCPHTSYFKPMARFHLPLATEEETIYRAASMYLLAQYFLYKQECDIDLELNGLKTIYENIHIVNRAMAERLRAASQEDSSVNALIILDLFAKTLPYAIKDSLKEIRYLFKPFIK